MVRLDWLLHVVYVSSFSESFGVLRSCLIFFERMGEDGSFFPHAKIQTNTEDAGAGEGACGGKGYP